MIAHLMPSDDSASRRSGAPWRQHDRVLRPVHGTDREAARTAQGGHAASGPNCNSQEVGQSGASDVHQRDRTDRRVARLHLSDFRSTREWPADAIFVLDDPTFIASRAAMAQAAARHRLPLICGVPEMTEAGCLFSYATSLKDMWYRSATFVDKILKGENQP